jgi:putative ABC transport system substrate-binding protein
MPYPMNKGQGKRLWTTDNERQYTGGMGKNTFIVLVISLALALVHLAQAQQPGKVFRIGMLLSGSVSTTKSRIDAFRQGLRELGYVEGKTIFIEYRYAEGKRERWPDLAAEVVRLKPDVIVVASNGFTAAAKQATTTIPIVVASAGDLVGTGLVASLARPGGNVTGSTNITPDLSGKRLELLKEVVPKAVRVAVLWYPSSSDEDDVKETEIYAMARGIKIQVVPVQGPDTFQEAFAVMKRENANALIIIQGSFTLFHRTALVELATKNRLPSMCVQAEWAENGCLLSYGPDPVHQHYRAAIYVDKILKGTKPADLPVEQPTKFELVINLKTAKQIGLTIPQSVLYRADKVIR